MDKEFSNGFMQEIANLLEICSENNTDSIELEFDINGITVVIDIVFSIKEDGKEIEIND